jgi:HAD superfamily hydrolase (TIGR01459 family)
MSTLEFPEGLAGIADQYDAILCDVWGVMHNGREAFRDACDALSAFRAEGRPVILITNAPVPGRVVVGRHFDRLGIAADTYDDIVSSGDAARIEIEKRTPAAVWSLTSENTYEADRTLFDGLRFAEAGPHDCDLVVAMGLKDYFNDHPEDYRTRLRMAATRHITLICANPDIQVRIGDQLAWTAGALARIYEEEGGTVIYPGKPHDAIYDLAEQHLARLAGRRIARDRILAIGDGPITDILGAMNRGMDALYVGTGLTLAGPGDFRSDTRGLLDRNGVTARYAMPELRW